jgi:hypothetical protein
MSARGDAYHAFLRMLDKEIVRRRIAAAGGDPIEALLGKFDEMAERLQVAPGWRAPTPAQQRQSAHRMEMWFKRNGYMRGSY